MTELATIDEGTTRVENDRNLVILARIQDSAYTCRLAVRSVTVADHDVMRPHWSLHLYELPMYDADGYLSLRYAGPHHVEAFAAAVGARITEVTSFPDRVSDSTGSDSYATWELYGLSAETGTWRIRIFAAMPTETGSTDA